MKLVAFIGALALVLGGPSLAFANHSTGEEGSLREVEHEESAETHVQPVAVAVDAHCVIETSLGLGSRGPAVVCLQDLLMKSGDLNTIDAPTGYFGALTQAAVKKWQTSHGIESTGYFGTLSRAQLGGHTESEEHAHTGIDVSEWEETPSVSLTLHKDAMAGYNLEVTPKHFTFAPEHVNGAVVEGEGHAHVYINGTKYARLYGPWMYLSGDLFKKGENEVRVTLNANTHSDLMDGEDVIEAVGHVHID